MLEARKRQPEVVEPMLERLARDGDAEPAHIGEIRQAHPTGRMLLAEDHVPAGAVESPPAALQGPAHPMAISGCRRHSSSKIATARPPGAASSIARSRSPTPRQAGRDAAAHEASPRQAPPRRLLLPVRPRIRTDDAPPVHIMRGSAGGAVVGGRRVIAANGAQARFVPW
jgi:hypothetical protein